MTKRIGRAWIVGAVLLGSPAVASAAPVVSTTRPRVMLDRVVAVVGDQILLWSELQRAVVRNPAFQDATSQLPKNATPADIEKLAEAFYPRVLDEMIDAALVRAEARKFDITVTEEDVDRASLDVARQYGMSLEELRRQVEESDEYGSWQEYRDELRDQILQFKVPHYLATWSVSEAQVREHYRKMTKDETAKVKVVQFAFRPSADTPEARNEALAAAQSLGRQLREGADVEDLLDDETLPGEERALARGDLSPAVADALFAAEDGDVVGPLASGPAYVVFAVREHVEAAVRGYEEAKEQIRTQLENEAFMKANIEMRQQLRAKAHIDVRL